jgi:hypothetical protein
MRLTISLFSAAALTVSAVLICDAAVAADAPKSDDREEIIVTHSRLGPLSEWAQMQAHNAEYRRLKEKFDPTTSTGRVDADTSDRALAAPTSGNGAFMSESASAPTPSAIKAVEDAVAPP